MGVIGFIGFRYFILLVEIRFRRISDYCVSVKGVGGCLGILFVDNECFFSLLFLKFE